jgi:hypothetical protein
MHAPLDFLSSTFTNSTCKGQAWWAANINFAGISWWHVKKVELGSMDMTQSMKHQVEGPIMCHTRFSKENQVQAYMHDRINFHAYS